MVVKSFRSIWRASGWCGKVDLIVVDLLFVDPVDVMLDRIGLDGLDGLWSVVSWLNALLIVSMSST
jgi:hypothetical protein